MAWADTAPACLEANGVRTVVHVPDMVLTGLIRLADDDPSIDEVDRTLASGWSPRRPALIKHRFMGRLGTLMDVGAMAWE